MELDNIIYIIATIVIFIVSIIGQGKKKKKLQKPVANEEVEYSLNDFERILERKQEFRQEEEQPVQIEMEPKEPEEEIVAEKPTKRKRKILEKEEKANDDGFDLKSAIIYSSILERKKYRH